MGEHQLDKLGVTGSSPVPPTLASSDGSSPKGEGPDAAGGTALSGAVSSDTVPSGAAPPAVPRKSEGNGEECGGCGRRQDRLIGLFPSGAGASRGTSGNSLFVRARGGDARAFDLSGVVE